MQDASQSSCLPHTASLAAPGSPLPTAGAGVVGICEEHLPFSPLHVASDILPIWQLSGHVARPLPVSRGRALRFSLVQLARRVGEPLD